MFEIQLKSVVILCTNHKHICEMNSADQRNEQFANSKRILIKLRDFTKNRTNDKIMHHL